MNRRKYTSTELGMMYGLVIGGGIGIILFAITNDAFWFAAGGVGLALGLGIGATMDKRES